VAASHIYDFLLVDDRIEEAVSEMEEIVFRGRGRPMAEARAFLAGFFQ
jgi:hypothetical protein